MGTGSGSRWCPRCWRSSSPLPRHEPRVGPGLRGRSPRWERMRLSGVAFVVGDIAFMSAAVWYATRGAFDEFWASWFTYARYMAVGTGASLGSQFGLGWDSFYAYHERV